MAQWVTDPVVSMGMKVQSLARALPVFCNVGHRCSSDLVLLWLWHRMAVAASIGLLAWELPYAADTWERKRKENRSKIKD